MTVRSVFVIGPDKAIKLVIHLSCVDRPEFRRSVEGHRLPATHGELRCGHPLWTGRTGEDVVIAPAIQDKAELDAKFPKGYTVVKPYLRITPQPNK